MIKNKVNLHAMSGCGECVECTHELCAERRLLEKAKENVSKQRRVTAHTVRSFIKYIHVERTLKDGTLGCSKPCLGCQAALKVLDIKVRYWDDGWKTQRSVDIQGGSFTHADRMFRF